MSSIHINNLNRVGVVGAVCLSAMNFVLGILVSRQRMKQQKSIGYDEKDLSNPLTKACRAHINHSEYTPTMIALMLFVESKSMITNTPVPLPINALMVGYVAARIMLTLSLLIPKDLTRPSIFRRIGATANYLVGLALAGSLLFQ
ncbi:hypothetical protein ABK040_007247 [Willaertia magna]